MSASVEVLEVARQEFDEAYAHYESTRVGLGEEFRKEVRWQVLKIKEHPDAWMLVSPEFESVSAGVFHTMSFIKKQARTF